MTGVQPAISGTVKAKRGNKYVLDMGDRVPMSNGVAVWNYAKGPNSVVISNFFEDKARYL